jgi:hypothetical protein
MTVIRGKPRVATAVQHVPEQGGKPGVVQPITTKPSVVSKGGVGVVVHLSKTDAVPELPQPHLFNMIMRDYEDSPLRMENGLHELDGLDDLDNPTEADYNVDEWFPEDGSNDQD